MPAPTFYFDVITSSGSDSLSDLSEFNDALVVSWDLDDGAFATLVIDADRELELPLNLKVEHFVLRVVQG